MPRKKQPLTRPVVPLIDAPPLGHLQLQVLMLLEELGEDASGTGVLAVLRAETGVWLDQAKVFSTIRTLLGEGEKRYIEFVRDETSTAGGPPLKIWRVTKEGRAAIEATLAHYLAVAAFCQKRRRRRQIA